MVNLESVSGGRGPADHAASGSLVYLDHAATTPVLPEALAALMEELALTGNPSSLHNAGRRARRVVEESREQIAQAFGPRPRRRILATAIEHHAVLDSVQWLAEHQGAQVDWLPVDSAGLLTPEGLRAAIERDPDSVALVSVMWANNEVGTIQPVAALAAVASEHGIPFHSDAVQAAGLLPVDLAASGAAALTITGHKLGGPVGAGALLLARGEDPVPVLHGGGQERDVRSGTLDAAAIRAFAVAVETATAGKDEHAARLGRLRDSLIGRVRATVPDAILNGPAPGAHRLPGNAHFSFPGCEGDALLMLLDARGVACSTGSACTAGVAQPSHVLLAMGADRRRASGSLRFSLGWTSTQADVDALGAVIGEVVDRAGRAARQAGDGQVTGRADGRVAGQVADAAGRRADAGATGRAAAS